MMQRFHGRVAMITGAGNGIGRAIAARLHSEGASVLLADLEADAATEVAESLGERAAAVRCDVTDRSGVQAAVADCLCRFGALDVLACNVGTAGPQDFLDLDDAAWAAQMEPTLHGSVICIQAALPQLIDSRFGGSVVMTGSVNGLAAFGNVAYSAAKAGLGNVAANLSVRYGAWDPRAAGRPVRFNVVAPGTTRTRVWDAQDQDPDKFAASTRSAASVSRRTSQPR